jgi:hypothetical protein
MKKIQELLKQKEAELQLVQREVEALRIVNRLLGPEDDAAAPANVTSISPIPMTAGTPLAAMSRAHKDNGHAIADGTGRQFP